MKRKDHKPVGAFKTYAEYAAQFDDDLQQLSDEDRALDQVMDAQDQASDAQHLAREEGTDIIDDMAIREWRL